eukprot:4282069-Pleurochrysis_carterae.AAC.1
MARSPYKQWSISSVATSTTINIALSCQSDVSDLAARGSSYTSPAALTAATLPWLLLYPTWVLHTFLASKPITQLAISQYPSDIAIESNY